MAWAKVDDGWWCHPKVMGLGLAARGLWVSALSWSCAQRRDVVPASFVAMVGGSNDEANALADAGLWVADGGGWRIHDWAQYQELSISEKRAEAGAKGGKRSGEARRRAKQTEATAEQEPKQVPIPSQPIPLSSQSDQLPEPAEYRTVIARARSACTLVAERRAAPRIAAGGVTSPERYTASIIEGVLTDHIDEAQRIARDQPDWTDAQIADRIAPRAVSVPYEESRHPAVVASQKPADEAEPVAGQSTVADAVAAARAALAEVAL